LAAIWNRGHCSESINLFSCSPFFQTNVNIFYSLNWNSRSPCTIERLTRNRSCDTRGTWRSLPAHQLYGFRSGNPQQSTATLVIPKFIKTSTVWCQFSLHQWNDFTFSRCPV
jgi:hypothetical protein